MQLFHDYCEEDAFSGAFVVYVVISCT